MCLWSGLDIYLTFKLLCFSVITVLIIHNTRFYVLNHTISVIRLHLPLCHHSTKYIASRTSSLMILVFFLEKNTHTKRMCRQYGGEWKNVSKMAAENFSSQLLSARFVFYYTYQKNYSLGYLRHITLKELTE